MDYLRSTLAIRFAQCSDAGIKPENQDTVGARIPEGSLLTTKGIAIAIADGVSSSSTARQASQTAITGFLTDYYATPDTWRTQQSALQVIQSLNRYLWGQSQNSVRQEGYLTTFSALILKGDTAFLFHVGDSRIYRFRGTELEQLTRDHTQKIDRNTTYLSRALGADPSLEIDSQSLEIEIGDVFLLTTDGVHEVLPLPLLQAMLSSSNGDLEVLVADVMASALAHGSKDNISIQACRIDARGTPSQSDAVSMLSRLPFPPLLEIGQVIDGLTVDKILHESERSQVYLVHTTGGNRLVMKTPSVNYEDDPAYIERFAMESWIGARLQNPHVVRVVEPPQARSCLYYLTEYVSGQTLAEVIRQRAPLGVQDAVELLEQLVKAVRAFHRKDTLHQDIKPANVVIGAKGAVLIDFGSCAVAGVQEMGSPISGDLVLGTLDYSAPEYRYGGPIGHRADQFSLAVLLYEMLTGKRPYGDGYGKAMTLKAFQRLQYVPAAKHNPLVPVWLDRAIEKALNIYPNGRYAALSEWLTDIKRPNPSWISPRELPLIERSPLRFWQGLAILGWLLALLLWIKILEG